MEPNRISPLDPFAMYDGVVSAIRTWKCTLLSLALRATSGGYEPSQALQALVMDQRSSLNHLSLLNYNLAAEYFCSMTRELTRLRRLRLSSGQQRNKISMVSFHAEV